MGKFRVDSGGLTGWPRRENLGKLGSEEKDGEGMDRAVDFEG